MKGRIPGGAEQSGRGLGGLLPIDPQLVHTSWLADIRP